MEYRPYTGQKEIAGYVDRKNLLENKRASQTINGVTFTINSDDSVTANGTATENSILVVANNNASETIGLKNGTYILTGCPNGGSITTYKIHIWNYDGLDSSVADFGSGVEFKLTNEDGKYNVAITVRKGYTASNLTFYPMIRPASIEDDTYEPFNRQTHIHTGSLPGIPLGQTIPDAIANSEIHMAGVYYDEETEQYYIGDTVDYSAGECVQRVADYIFDGSSDESWIYADSYGGVYEIKGLAIGLLQYDTPLLCNYGKKRTWGNGLDIFLFINEYKDFVIGGSDIIVSFPTLEAFKEHLAENPITVKYILATPITSTITAEEMESYYTLHSNKPVTQVSNDCDAYMKFGYNADPKNHIEQNYIPKSEFEALVARVETLENA